MGETIWKYPLVAGALWLKIPGLRRFLTVGYQNDGPVLWAIADPSEPEREYQVWVATTGGAVPSTTPDYLGTFQDGWFVGHVFVKQPR